MAMATIMAGLLLAAAGAADPEPGAEVPDTPPAVAEARQAGPVGEPAPAPRPRPTPDTAGEAPARASGADTRARTEPWGTSSRPPPTVFGTSEGE